MANKARGKTVVVRAKKKRAETRPERRARIAEERLWDLQQELRSAYADLREERGRAWQHMRLAHQEQESAVYTHKTLRGERAMVETERKRTEALKDEVRGYITTVLTYADQARVILSKAKEPTDDVKLAQVALARVFQEPTPPSLNQGNPLWQIGVLGLGIVGALAHWMYSKSGKAAMGAGK